MITLHTFGPAFGLPDASPFVTKADILLNMSQLPYVKVVGNLQKAPKGKLPLIDDSGTIIPDSSFIRLHLEKQYGIDFDKGLTREQRGQAWAIDKMLEDHLYWAAVSERWLDDANFDAGPRMFFKSAPAPLRPLIIAMVRRKVKKSLHAQGLGRHSRADMIRLASRAISALSDALGDKPFLMGSAPCGADATATAFVIACLCPVFTTQLRTDMESHANLVAYAARMTALYYPDLKAA